MSKESDTALFLKSLQDQDIIERVRVTIKNAHVFKLPPRQTVSVGWRGADWKEKVWQGTVKVVERGEITAVLLVDRTKGSIFAVCPVREGSVDRCVDSSRYFVLRIENATGRHMFIGVAFNERNDAFDFNTALEDSRREKEADLMPVKPYKGPTTDYSIKEGQKIHVNIPKVAGGSGKDEEDDNSLTRLDNEMGGTNTPSPISATAKKSVKKSQKKGSKKGLFLAPSSKDTPRRAPQTGVSSSLKGPSNSPTRSSAAENFGNDPFFSS